MKVLTILIADDVYFFNPEFQLSGVLKRHEDKEMKDKT